MVSFNASNFKTRRAAQLTLSEELDPVSVDRGSVLVDVGHEEVLEMTDDGPLDSRDGDPFVDGIGLDVSKILEGDLLKKQTRQRSAQLGMDRNSSDSRPPLPPCRLLRVFRHSGASFVASRLRRGDLPPPRPRRLTAAGTLVHATFEQLGLRRAI